MQPHKGGYEKKEKAALVLRVRKRETGADPRKDDEVKSERRIVQSLSGQGVVPPITAETTVIVRAQGRKGESPVVHGATVMRMFNSGSLDRPIDGKGPAVSLDGVGDALVELYARLSTVARCVDTKEGNVVVNVERENGVVRRTIALIDTDGHRCSVVRGEAGKAGEAGEAGGTEVLRYIGPLDRQDLDAMLFAAAAATEIQKRLSKVSTEDKEDLGTLLDDPLLFAAVCLLVLHVANAVARKSTYPDTREVLIRHFDLIWSLVMRYDKTRGLSKTQTAQSTLAHYSLKRDLRGAELRAHVLDVLRRQPKKAEAGKRLGRDGAHYRAYWCGTDRMIADDGSSAPAAASLEGRKGRSEIAEEIRKAAEREYGKSNLSESRLATHVALAERRFYHEVAREARERPLMRSPAMSAIMSERRAVMVRFRVDRITATALVAVLEREHTGIGPGAEPEQEPAHTGSALYTGDPAAEACARAIEAALRGP
jgi:hypothetical protein